MDEFEFEFDDEAPKTPVSRVFLKLYSPKSETVINCAMGFRDPINVESLKKAISDSIMIKHPRFCSLWVRDKNNNGSREHWKRANVNINDHIIVHQTMGGKDDEEDKEATVNSFLADISVSTPLSEDKPLWEVHVLLDLKCVVLRFHHALGDGVSLMSMLSACFGDTTQSASDTTSSGDDKNNVVRREWRVQGMWGLFKSIWFTIVFQLRILGRILWVKDKSVLNGGDGVELWPRKILTAKFLLQDFKSIKLSIPNATVNDVLLGVISSGLSKYLNIKSSNELQHGLQLTAITPINQRKNFIIQEFSDLMMIKPKGRLSEWGNKSSVVLLPINCCNGLHPLEHVKAMKATMDKKKHSYDAHITFRLINFLVSCLSPKVGRWLFHRLICNTTLTISNIVGPSKEIVIAENPVTYIKVNISSIPQVISMYLVSYGGQANLQVMVAKDIVPDPELLVKCLQESFQEMKNNSVKMNIV